MYNVPLKNTESQIFAQKYQEIVTSINNKENVLCSCGLGRCWCCCFETRPHWLLAISVGSQTHGGWENMVNVLLNTECDTHGDSSSCSKRSSSVFQQTTHRTTPIVPFNKNKFFPYVTKINARFQYLRDPQLLGRAPERTTLYAVGKLARPSANLNFASKQSSTSPSHYCLN